MTALADVQRDVRKNEARLSGHIDQTVGCAPG
jgi:hypothetical protein